MIPLLSTIVVGIIFLISSTDQASSCVKLIVYNKFKISPNLIVPIPSISIVKSSPGEPLILSIIPAVISHNLVLSFSSTIYRLGYLSS